MGEVLEFRSPEKNKVWFLLRGQAQEGPYTDSEMREFVASGTLTPDLLVWREGMVSWAAIKQTTLFERAPVAPIPVKVRETIPATRGIRACAFALDLALLAVPNLIVKVALAMMFGGSLTESWGFEKGELVLDGISISVQLLFWVTYFGVVQTALSGSIGKRLCGLVIVSSSGKNCNLSQGIRRSLLQLVSVMTLGLALILIFWKKDKPIFYDRLTDCDVKRFK